MDIEQTVGFSQPSCIGRLSPHRGYRIESNWFRRVYDDKRQLNIGSSVNTFHGPGAQMPMIVTTSVITIEALTTIATTMLFIKVAQSVLISL